MFGRVLIISGGVVDIDFAKQYLVDKEFDTVVCADSGLDSAYQLGIPVHYAMGDFDSVSREVLQRYQQTERQFGVSTEFVSYPPEKDATDTQIVLDWVTEHKPEEIVILGATGKRLDHFLANVNILMNPLSSKVPTYMIDSNNKLYLTDDGRVFRKEELFGKYISLLPLTEKVTGVCLRGFKYELEDAALTIGTSLGVSNELGDGRDEALLELRAGVLIVVESKD